MAEWGSKPAASERELYSARSGTARVGATRDGPPSARGFRPFTSSAAERLAGPLIGVDGKPIDLGQSDWHLSDAKMTKQFVSLQQQNLSDLDKLNAKLRKEYDAVKLINKRKMKELQTVTGELSQVERVLSGSDRTNSLVAVAEATIITCEDKMQMAQEQCQAALHTSDMYEFMADRLQNEYKQMDLQIDDLGRELKELLAQHETASLNMHQAQAQKTRAVALVHTLTRHLEIGRAQRRLKMEKVESALADQAARLRDFDEKEKKRMNLSMMARGDLDEDGEDRLKQLFLVRKIYNNMLIRRLRDDQRRTDRLSAAYQKIRTATGLDDVDAIIHKYKTRDMTVATLNAQMKAARERVDMLAAERRQLVWALDEAQTLGASALEARALYNSVEDNDRKMAEAVRKVRESRDRLNRVSVTLEECRACIAKMLDRVGGDASAIAGVIAGIVNPGEERALSPGTRAASTLGRDVEGTEIVSSGGEPGVTRRRGSLGGALGAPGTASVLGNRSHTPGRPQDRSGSVLAPPAGVMDDGGRRKSITDLKVIQPAQLEAALSTLEQRVGQLLAHLAGIFEREVAASASNAKGKSKLRRGLTAAASTIGGGRSTTGSAFDTAAPAVTESDAAAHRISVAALTDKASNRVFQRLMTMEPDVSDRNVRIHARAPDGESITAKPPKHDRLSPSAAKKDVVDLVDKSAADLSKLLHGAGAGAVVDRVSLKRLAAMVATTMSNPGKSAST